MQSSNGIQHFIAMAMSVGGVTLEVLGVVLALKCARAYKWNPNQFPLDEMATWSAYLGVGIAMHNIALLWLVYLHPSDVPTLMSHAALSWWLMAGGALSTLLVLLLRRAKKIEGRLYRQLLAIGVGYLIAGFSLRQLTLTLAQSASAMTTAPFDSVWAPHVRRAHHGANSTPTAWDVAWDAYAKECDIHHYPIPAGIVLKKDTSWNERWERHLLVDHLIARAMPASDWPPPADPMSGPLMLVPTTCPWATVAQR